jgi:outer membrane protein assembly factor BamB
LPEPAPISGGHFETHGVTFDNGYMYASDHGTAWKVDLATRQLVWVHQEGVYGNVVTLHPPMLHDGRLYVWNDPPTYDPAHQVLILDPSNGSVLGYLPAYPLGFDGQLVFMQLRSPGAPPYRYSLVAQDEQGQTRWTYQLGAARGPNPLGTPIYYPNELWMTPAIANGIIYAVMAWSTGDPGHILAIDTATGQLLGTQTTFQFPTNDYYLDGTVTPTLVGKTVLIPTEILEAFTAS